MSIRVAPGAPRGLPRLPDVEPVRRCRSRPSDEGGFELFDESIPNRRRNSATSASNAATYASRSASRGSCSTSRATKSSYDGRCDSKPDPRALCHTNHTTLIKGHNPGPQTNPAAGQTHTASPYNTRSRAKYVRFDPIGSWPVLRLRLRGAVRVRLAGVVGEVKS
jgi:hypothetical protein